MTQSTNQPTATHLEAMALTLRVGLGAVFVIGGWNKLSQLIDPLREAAIVGSYMSPHGYINAFFAQYLFEGPIGTVLTPWGFLTALSTFELVSGVALILGLLVRPLAFVYGFLLWTFVMALPVTTSPEVAVTVKTYTAPAILVQIRDIALSGMMFVLFNMGPGRMSLDARVRRVPTVVANVNWNNLGLLLRLSVAAPLIVGGFFVGLPNIQSFASPGLLLAILGIAMAAGLIPRVVGSIAAAVFLWYAWTKMGIDKSLIANLNGFKREIALFAASGIFAFAGGGSRYTVTKWMGGVTHDNASQTPTP